MSQMNYREFCEKANSLGWRKSRVQDYKGFSIVGRSGNVCFVNKKSEDSLWDIITYEEVKKEGFDKILGVMGKYKEEQVRA